MTNAQRVRCDYEQMTAIAARFQGQAAQVSQTLQNIKRQLQTLQQGDWVGEGATLFYQEMATSVVPSLERLDHALQAAATSTRQISLFFQQAEEEAAAILRISPGNNLFGSPVGGSAFMPVSAPGGAGSKASPATFAGNTNAEISLLSSQIETQFGVKISQSDNAIGTKNWEKQDLEDLQHALSKLTPAERERIKGFTFERWKGPYEWTNAKANSQATATATLPNTAAGLTIMTPGKPADNKIAIFDAAFSHRVEETPSNTGGVKYTPGTPKYGVPEGERLILHEIGHALGKNSTPAGFDKAMGGPAGKTALTEYGKTASDESYAEAFSIYKGDPQQLKRERPRAYDWFRDGKHLH